MFCPDAIELQELEIEQQSRTIAVRQLACTKVCQWLYKGRTRVPPERGRFLNETVIAVV